MEDHQARTPLTRVRSHDRTLIDIALARGFKSAAHFSTAFRQRYGMSPREYRARVRGSS